MRIAGGGLRIGLRVYFTHSLSKGSEGSFGSAMLAICSSAAEEPAAHPKKISEN
jgi:hypothetical protein